MPDDLNSSNNFDSLVFENKGDLKWDNSQNAIDYVQSLTENLSKPVNKSPSPFHDRRFNRTFKNFKTSKDRNVPVVEMKFANIPYPDYIPESNEELIKAEDELIKDLEKKKKAIDALDAMELIFKKNQEKQVKAELNKVNFNELSKEELKNSEIKREKEIESLENIPFKYIYKVGCELEGAYITGRNDLHEDASFGAGSFKSGRYRSIGEYVSKPFDNSVDFFKCIIENFPDDSVPQCGYHIHVSFKKPTYYVPLMEVEFFEYCLKKLSDWGNNYQWTDGIKRDEFWNRFNGGNKYCRREFIPDEQAAFKEKGVNRLSRRTILHYCYGQTGTLELRLFPMFNDAKTAISAATAFIKCVESYLEDHPPKEMLVIDSLDEENQEPPLETEEEVIALDDNGKKIRNVIKKKLEKMKPFNFFELYNEEINASSGYIRSKFKLPFKNVQIKPVNKVINPLINKPINKPIKKAAQAPKINDDIAFKIKQEYLSNKIDYQGYVNKMKEAEKAGLMEF